MKTVRKQHPQLELPLLVPELIDGVAAAVRYIVELNHLLHVAQETGSLLEVENQGGWLDACDYALEDLLDIVKPLEYITGRIARASRRQSNGDVRPESAESEPSESEALDGNAPRRDGKSRSGPSELLEVPFKADDSPWEEEV